jgi:carbon monoxide dehydrogenase subunit G
VKVSGEYLFDVTPDQVWAALHDRAMLAAALPGARRLEPVGEDEYAVAVDVGVGSIKGTYDGTFALTDQVARESCTVRASASGRPGSVQAVARMRLSERDGGALMAYEADASLTGPLAGVGQRLVGAAARRTTEQFLAELERLIVAPPEAAAGPRDQAPGRIAAPARGGADPKVIAASALAGAAVALAGVAVGRWTARR